jgi:hypothetical protein
MENPCLNAETWPNFHNIDPWKNAFTNTPAGITTIDIRSLYPSAAVKKCLLIHLCSSLDVPDMTLKQYTKEQKIPQ